jgi:hypothetical protein
VLWWGITYAFLPLAHLALMPEALRGDASHARHFFCRLRCCAPARAASASAATLALLRDAGALAATVQAARAHALCSRPAARLFAMLCRGDAGAAALLVSLGAAHALALRYPSSAQPAAGNQPSLRRRGKAAVAAAAAAAVAPEDNDSSEDGGEDGECLSEWDVLETIDSAVWYADEAFPTLALARCAQRELAAASAAADARAREVAAEAAAAELLAEEAAAPKRDSGKGNKSKSKSQSKQQQQQPVHAAQEAHGHDAADDDAAAAVDEDDAMARLLLRAQLPTTQQRPGRAQRRPGAQHTQAAGAASTEAVHAAAFRVPQLPPAPPSAAPPRRPRWKVAPFAVAAQAGTCGCGNAACATGGPLASFAGALSTDAEIAARFPRMALRDEPPPAAPAAAMPCVDAPHEDDELCVCCLDAPRDTPLAGCAAAHAPVVCAGCAGQLLAGAAPACPLCRAPATA